MRTVWFHREYIRFSGGHLKHAHYVGHVASMPGFIPKITFTGNPASQRLAEERRQLWPESLVENLPDWRQRDGDILFVAGKDWHHVRESAIDAPPNPVINLVQGVRHADVDTDLHEFLSYRAIRICVSREVANAIRATGQTNGPVFVIPNGTDVEPSTQETPCAEDGKTPVVVSGYKRPGLAKLVIENLTAANVKHRAVTNLQNRGDFLDTLAASQVAVCLPLEKEGFYLPALEAMAMGCLVVTLDCIGNRGFCRGDENCLVAEPTAESLTAAAQRALRMPNAQRQRLRKQALETVRRHTLSAERKRFHKLLNDVDRLWESIQ